MSVKATPAWLVFILFLATFSGCLYLGYRWRDSEVIGISADLEQYRADNDRLRAANSAIRTGVGDALRAIEDSATSAGEVGDGLAGIRRYFEVLKLQLLELKRLVGDGEEAGPIL